MTAWAERDCQMLCTADRAPTHHILTQAGDNGVGRGGLLVHVGMEHVAGESDPRGLLWIVFSECNPQAEDTSLPGGVIGAKDCTKDTQCFQTIHCQLGGRYPLRH